MCGHCCWRQCSRTSNQLTDWLPRRRRESSFVPNDILYFAWFIREFLSVSYFASHLLINRYQFHWYTSSMCWQSRHASIQLQNAERNQYLSSIWQRWHGKKSFPPKKIRQLYFFVEFRVLFSLLRLLLLPSSLTKDVEHSQNGNVIASSFTLGKTGGNGLARTLNDCHTLALSPTRSHIELMRVWQSTLA